MKVNTYLILFLVLIFVSKSHAQQDSISAVIPRVMSTDDYYRHFFTIFDTIKKNGDTLYFMPIDVEPKLTIVDSVSYNQQQSVFHKVVVSSYQVSARGKSGDISYYQSPERLELFYNNVPFHTYQLPYDQWNPKRSSTSYWKKQNVIGLDLNQSSFVNWNAGGFNSISGIAKGDFTRIFEKGRTLWTNELKIRYGLNKQDEQEVRKTDDVLSLNSAYGYRTSVNSLWYYTAKLTLNTQMANGYAYPDVTQPISRFFAPAYVFLGIGAEYTNKTKTFQMYISPATLKSTLVLDDVLANSGAFGVEAALYDENGVIIRKGKKSKNEFGFLFTNQFKKEIMKNVLLDSKLALYTDYLHHFGNIDVDWQLQLEMRVNNYIKATFGGQLIYDDDIKNKRDVDGVQITEGPKVQIKQLLGIGVVYSF